jgi:Mg2+-importing ATPase
MNRSARRCTGGCGLIIIVVVVVASGTLGFWQEHSAGRAVDALPVRVRVEVRHDGPEVSIPSDEVVVGDVVVLSAGDIVPADCRVIESHSLQLDEAALTGELFPAEKTRGEVSGRRRCAGFMG